MDWSSYFVKPLSSYSLFIRKLYKIKIIIQFAYSIAMINEGLLSMHFKMLGERIRTDVPDHLIRAVYIQLM